MFSNQILNIKYFMMAAILFAFRALMFSVDFYLFFFQFYYKFIGKSPTTSLIQMQICSNNEQFDPIHDMNNFAFCTLHWRSYQHIVNNEPIKCTIRVRPFLFSSFFSFFVFISRWTATQLPINIDKKINY